MEDADNAVRASFSSVLVVPDGTCLFMGVALPYTVTVVVERPGQVLPLMRLTWMVVVVFRVRVTVEGTEELPLIASFELTVKPVTKPIEASEATLEALVSASVVVRYS